MSLIRGGSLPRSNPTEPPGESIYFKCVVRGEKVGHKKNCNFGKAGQSPP